MPHRTRAAPLEAVAHLLHLLGDVDVDRRLGVDRIRECDGIAQRLVRNRAQRVRRDAEAQVRPREAWPQPVDEMGEAIQVVHEAALPGLGRAAAEAARHVQHRQMGQADAARPLRLEDRPGQLRRIGVGPPIALMMQWNSPTAV